MSDVTHIDFRLRAHVNGTTFDMNGEGRGDAAEGTCTLELEASPGFPPGFDPVSCPCICSHPTSTYFARPAEPGIGLVAVAGDAYEVSPARNGLIHDAEGEELLRLQVTGRVRREGSRLISEHEMWGESHLPALDHNDTPLDDYYLPGGPGRATALVRFGLVTEEGETLDGITTVPYRWNSRSELPVPLVRRVEDIRVEWDGGPRVTAHYRTVVRPLGTSTEDQRAGAVDTVAHVPELVG